MTIEDLAKSEGIWSSSVKDNFDIVLKSSIKFFRNLEGYFFYHKLGRRQREVIQSLLLEKIQNSNSLPSFSVYRLDKISNSDKKIFSERNIIKDSQEEKYTVVLSDDQICCFILGGKDHVELVTTQSGLRLDEVYISGKKLISDLEQQVGFAYNPELGFLSADPNHLGSGIEILVTFHLSGLTISDRINEISAVLEKNGFGLRGSWLEAYYDIYNKSSTGTIEEDLYEGALRQFEWIVKMEKEARETVFNESRAIIEDRVWRSYGTLLSARLISLYEVLDHLSHLRLGISLGVINYITIKDINLLLYYIQDYHLRKLCNLKNSDGNLEEVRAKFIRNYLKEVI